MQNSIMCLDFKKKVLSLLDEAGIKIDGSEPWDIQVHNDRLYERTLLGGTISVGEAYMDGWWDVERLELFF